MFPFTEKLHNALQGLSRAIAAFAARRPAAVCAMICAGHQRLQRIERRLAAMHAKLQAGTLRPPPPRRPRPTTQPAPETASRQQPHPLLPKKFGWLMTLAPPAATHHQYVAEMVHDPEALRLVQTAPQAGRLFRPLCHMMAIPLPEHLRLPKRIRTPGPRIARAAQPDSDIPEPDSEAAEKRREVERQLPRRPSAHWPILRIDRMRERRLRRKHPALLRAAPA